MESVHDQTMRLQLRHRGKWLWARLSDISLLGDIVGWVGGGAGAGVIKLALSIAFGLGAAVLAMIQQTPMVVVFLSALLATGITFWLINQVVAVTHHFRGPAAPAQGAGSTSSNWFKQNWGLVFMIGGVALVAFGWQSFTTSKTKAPPPRSVAAKSAPAPTPKIQAAKAEAAPAKVPERETLAPPPRIIYLPSPAPKVPRPKEPASVASLAPSATPPAPDPKAEPLPQAAPAKPAEPPKAPAVSRDVMIIRISLVRRHRELGEEVFNQLFDANTDEKVVIALNKARAWDRAGADMAGDYFGPAARAKFFETFAISDYYYHIGHESTTVTTFLKRRNYLNQIRAHQAILGDLASQARASIDAQGGNP